MPTNPYRGYRFPKEIISQCVWLYFNFALSLRDVELMMAFRGVLLTYETIRNWCDKFGPVYAAQLGISSRKGNLRTLVIWTRCIQMSCSDLAACTIRKTVVFRTINTKATKARFSPPKLSENSSQKQCRDNGASFKWRQRA